MASEIKQKAAWDLFVAGYNQTEIARILGLSKNTVNKWSSVNDWKGKKARLAMLDDNIVLNLKDIAEYQVRALKAMKDQYEEDGTFQLIPNGHLDGIQKALSTIKEDFNNFKANVNVLKRFMNYLEVQDIDLAKKLIPHMDAYLNEIHTIAQ